MSVLRSTKHEADLEKCGGAAPRLAAAVDQRRNIHGGVAIM